jgi:hypothetical protein
MQPQVSQAGLLPADSAGRRFLHTRVMLPASPPPTASLPRSPEPADHRHAAPLLDAKNASGLACARRLGLF